MWSDKVDIASLWVRWTVPTTLLNYSSAPWEQASGGFADKKKPANRRAQGKKKAAPKGGP